MGWFLLAPTLKSTVFVLVSVCLIAAVALVVIGSSITPENRFTGSVTDLLPEPPPGWSRVARPIAESEEMQAAVDNILNYDDAIFIDYLNPSGDRLSLYIAYWRAGSTRPREVAAHTPDVCWVGNGWQIESSSTISAWGKSKRAVPLAELRKFSIQGRNEYVAFWHISGGEVLSYGKTGPPPWYASFIDAWEGGLDQRREQVFIRVSAANPLQSEAYNPIVNRLLDSLAGLVGSEVSDA